MEAHPVQVVKNRKKSATYYEKHKDEIRAKRKERYQANKERLQTIQREYARKKRAELKALKFADTDEMYDNNEDEDISAEQSTLFHKDIKQMLINELSTTELSLRNDRALRAAAQAVDHSAAQAIDRSVAQAIE